MGTTVQARLDKETSAEMNAFLSRKGWSTSKTVREAIRLLVRQEGTAAPPVKIHGLGEFDFGVSDLSTNRKYLEGYGQRSMPGGKSRKKTVKR